MTVDLSKTFMKCLHCGARFQEPRHVCADCDWPRQHSDETAAPSSSLANPNAAVDPIVPQQAQGIIPLPEPVQGELLLSDVAAPVPVPQAPPVILGDTMLPTTRRRQPKTLQLAPEQPEGETK